MRALLAGGLVLGVGAAVTMAAWNDSEFAQGTFAAGTFNIVGSTNGTTFTDHATTGAAAPLSFAINPTTLSPGDVVYAPFAVELDATTTTNAITSITNAASTGVVTNLTYTLFASATFGCSASTVPTTTLVPAGTAVGVVPASTTFTLTKSVDNIATGAPVFLCFAVTAGSVVQGQSGTSTWQFTAASQ